MSQQWKLIFQKNNLNKFILITTIFLFFAFIESLNLTHVHIDFNEIPIQELH